MKAIVHDAYGSPDVLRLAEIERPVPADGEVLVRVRAASVHPDVWHVVAGFPYVMRLMGSGLCRPKFRIPGTDLAGVVEEVGDRVTTFQPGDEVFGECLHKHQWINGGTFAEHAAVKADTLAPKPEGVSFEEAASVPTSGIIALINLRDYGRLQPGQHLLINGAGGCLGSLAIQIAKSYGATVTGVDNGEKLDLMRSLGADHVVDYTAEDFTRGAERYDLILDVASTLTIAEAKRALNPDGTYVIVGHDHFGRVGRRVLGSIPRMFGLTFMSLFVSQLRKKGKPIDDRDPLTVLAELLADGKITPMVDRTFPLAEAREALEYLVAGQSTGRIILVP